MPKRKRPTALGLFLGIAVFASHSAAAEASCRSSKAAQPLLDVIAADNATDLDRVMQYYTDDPVWISPNAPPRRGVESVRESYVSMYAEFRPHLGIEVANTKVGGGVAVVRGRTTGWLDRRNGGARRVVNDQYESIVLCVGGSWRVATLRWWPDKRR